MEEETSYKTASIFIIIVRIDETGRYVLMVSNKEKETARGIKKSGWSLVGGGRQKLETSRQALMREVEEETGLTVPDEVYRRVPQMLVKQVGDDHANVLFGPILYSSEMGELAPRDESIIRAEWVPEYELEYAYECLLRGEVNRDRQPEDNDGRNYHARHLLMLYETPLTRHD